MWSPIYGAGELADATLPRKAITMSIAGERTATQHR